MKGDFSKLAFDKSKHYHDVLMQQGRVLLDQEWNEQSGIQAHRTETGVADIIGDSGAPFHNGGFGITAVLNGGSPPALLDLQISKGRYYVDGILVENPADVLFLQQPDFAATPLPAPLASPPAAGTYLFYLDVWLRHITALEDEAIREVALGGPDTTTRTKVVWQVKYIQVEDGTFCSAGIPSIITTASTGTLNARVLENIASTDPCGLNASGGYTRLQNQLYRVEIHNGGNRDQATFKWSRENGSVLTKCTDQEAANKNNLIVSSTGRDDLLGFKSGNWIEVINSDNDLLNTPGILVEISNVSGNVISIKPDTIIDSQNPTATEIIINTGKNTRIRRWESAGAIKPNKINGTWVVLEDGIEVNFRTGTFKTGDYWLIPARTATANVVWPFTSPQLPQGIQHHFAQLAIAKLDAGGWSMLQDCRNIFPPLTNLTSLYYVGGDGQQGLPGNKLPDTLKVGVANGSWPVANRAVRFEILSGGGLLNGSNTPIILVTDAEGIAACEYILSATVEDLIQVKASLADSAGNALPDHLPLIFNAAFSISGKNKKECCSTVGSGGDFETFELAIRALQEEKFICICLLPEEHKIGEGSLGNLDSKRIKITGCGAVVLLFGNIFKLEAEEIVLQDFTIKAADFQLDTRILITAHKLHCECCSFIAFTKELYQSTPFVLVKALFTENIMTEAEVNWKRNNCIIEGEKGAAVGFGQRITGWIRDNNIEGDLILQYDTKFRDIDWRDFLTDHERLPNKQEIERKLKSLLKLITSGVSLHVTGNTVNRVGTNAYPVMSAFREMISGQDMREAQPAFGHLIVSENIFKRGVGGFVAALLTMSNNHFINDKPNVLVGFAIGYRSIFAGNIDDVFIDTSTGGIIETIFHRKIASSNLIEVR